MVFIDLNVVFIDLNVVFIDLNDPNGALKVDLDVQAIFVQRNTANYGLSSKSRQRNLLSVDSQCTASD